MSVVQLLPTIYCKQRRVLVTINKSNRYFVHFLYQFDPCNRPMSIGFEYDRYGSVDWDEDEDEDSESREVNEDFSGAQYLNLYLSSYALNLRVYADTYTEFTVDFPEHWLVITKGYGIAQSHLYVKDKCLKDNSNYFYRCNSLPNYIEGNGYCLNVSPAIDHKITTNALFNSTFNFDYRDLKYLDRFYYEILYQEKTNFNLFPMLTSTCNVEEPLVKNFRIPEYFFYSAGALIPDHLDTIEFKINNLNNQFKGNTRSNLILDENIKHLNGLLNYQY